MTDVAKNEDNKSSHTPSAVDELTQLRQIVFGQAQAELEQKIANLQTSLDKGFSSLSADINHRFQKLNEQIDQNFAAMEDRIQYVDKQHEDKSDNIHTELNNLAAEHEMFAASTEKNLEQLNNELDKEANQLKDNFSHELEALKQQLNKVSAELSSSKTDRKTLANLLSTMANNLQDDQA
ncbi:hypothetical protein N7931_08630 [Catenovulum sp. 2E275]|uniref:hypothetical protein n=1 Tax=Catenovulum sp. 2E275 TaxID=2980497 RepID=UPI0021CFE1B5|nr:hypothetical protein [Catenovulum sp. 2E275]MCU4675695.1 hypothetical protein [Catenovulum sp. 2E275]